MPILEQFLTNHILIFIHPYPPILVWLPWFLHRWSRLHRRSLHLWRFPALRSSRSGRRRCRSHQRLGRWKTGRAVISPTQTPNNAGLRGNSLQQYHTCLHGTKIYQNKLLTRRTAQIIWTFLGTLLSSHCRCRQAHAKAALPLRRCCRQMRVRRCHRGAQWRRQIEGQHAAKWDSCKKVCSRFKLAAEMIVRADFERSGSKKNKFSRSWYWTRYDKMLNWKA